MKPVVRPFARSHRVTAKLSCAFAALSLLATACTEKTVYVAAEGGATAGSVDGGAAPDSPDGDEEGGVPTLAPKAECERYLECVNQTSPAAGGTAVTLYGDASPCWKGSSADAQRCGDACGTERRRIANEGSKAPACGCTGDAECSKSFCTLDGACASEEWGKALAECEALPKALREPDFQSPSGSCWGIEAIRCDGIKALRSDGKDSDGNYVDSSNMLLIYKCGRAANASLTQAFPNLALPARAPAACKAAKLAGRFNFARIDCPRIESSVDLMEFHVVK